VQSSQSAEYYQSVLHANASQSLLVINAIR